MTALIVIAAIILVFALILSIRAHIHVEYEEEISAYAKWAFLKIPLYPRPEKEPKPKKEKKKEEKTEEEPPKEEEPKPKGPNPLKNIYENEQLEGIMDIFRKLLEIVGKFGSRLVNSFVIDEMFLDINVSRDDAASTAEEYGKMCRRVFPLTGAVVANCNVKKYSINVEPDYIGKGYSEFAFSLEISLNPRKLINAVLAFAFGALFKLGIRLIKDLKPKNPQPKQDKNGEAENSESAENMGTVMPVKQVVYPKYEQGTVHEPEIYVENNIDNKE